MDSPNIMDAFDELESYLDKRKEAMKPSDAELKPCPFCGAVPAFPNAEDVFGTFYDCGCEECGIASMSLQIIDFFDHPRDHVHASWDDELMQYGVEFIEVVRQQAIKEWNTRTPSTAPASVPAELVEVDYKVEAEAMYNWLTQLPGNILNAAVVCDYAGMCNFKRAIASQLQRQFANKAAAYGREQAQQLVPAAIRNDDDGELQPLFDDSSPVPEGWTMLYELRKEPPNDDA